MLRSYLWVAAGYVWLGAVYVGGVHVVGVPHYDWWFWTVLLSGPAGFAGCVRSAFRVGW